jgi:cytochrome c oxidase cbb3-type subunit I/II
LQQLGTPYPEGYEQIANEDLHLQAGIIAESLKKDGIEQEGLERKEIVALIAYLQRLGTDIKKLPETEK